MTWQFWLCILWQNRPLHFLWQNRPLYISNGVAQVNTRVFFLKKNFPPFSDGLHRLIPGILFFSPFSGGLPRVNTRVLFIYLFIFRPFPSSCPGLIPGIFLIFFFALFRRVRCVGRYVLPYPYLILLIILGTDGFEFFKYTELTDMCIPPTAFFPTLDNIKVFFFFWDKFFK